MKTGFLHRLFRFGTFAQSKPRPGSSSFCKGFIALILFALIQPGHIRADEAASAPRTEPDKLPKIELYGGYIRAGDSWFGYSGGVYALGEQLQSPGFQIRMMAGRGAYQYIRNDKPVFGQVTAAELLLGYQARLGELTLKAFVGAHYEFHLLDRKDAQNPIQGGSLGVKGALEGWLNLGRAGFASVDVSISSVHRSYWTRARAGYKVIPSLSIGPEIGGLGNHEFNQWNAGLFMRYEKDSISGELAGGWARDFSGDGSAYLTFTVGRKMSSLW